MEDGTVYTDVIEYKAAVTPPSTDGKHVAFAQIANPNYKETNKKMAGSQFKNITLYGIVQNSASQSVQPASLARAHTVSSVSLPVPESQPTITPGMKLAATAKLMKQQPSKNQPAQATALQQAMPETIPAMPTFAPGIQMPAANQIATPASAPSKTTVSKPSHIPMPPSFANAAAA